MAHPFTFTFKGLEFSLQNGGLFLGDREISFRDFFLFAKGKLDLTPKPTIVDIVLDTSGSEGLDDNGGDFDILREALVATGLVDTLADADADFTVFAPTDAAFIQLARDLGVTVADGDEAAALNGILAALEGLAGSPEAALETLSQILLYHVSPEGRTLEELQGGGTIATAQGSDLELRGVDLVDAEPDIANPQIVAPDIEASNGTIQVIDRVLLPIDLPGNDQPNIVDIAVDNGNFTILVRALETAGLVETVTNLQDVTVFAPTDAAFAQLAVDLGFDGDTADLDAVFNFLVAGLDALSGGDPVGLLTDILLYHVSPGAKSAAAIDALPEISTLLTGATFSADGTELNDNEPDIDNPNIVIPDILGDNGTIQAIDRVLIPLDIPGNTSGEVIEGTDRRDHLTGTEGDDEIFGLKGSDKLDGGEGDDTLDGGNGRDLLDGGAGDDHLIGGRGRDYFDFRDLEGDDTVKDFSRGDRLVLDHAEFANLHDVRSASEQVGDDLVITGETGSITLEDTDQHDLNFHNIIFA